MGGEQTTTTVEPDGSTITTIVRPDGSTTTTTVSPEGVVTISSRIESLSCMYLPEGSEGRDACVHAAVTIRREPASRCNEIADADLKADCIANSPAGQTGG